MWAWGPCHSSYSLPLWWAHTTYNALWLHSHTPLVCTHSLWWPPTSDQPSRHQRLPQQQIWRANLMHWKSTLQYSVSYTLWPDILSSTYTGWFHQHQHNKKACQNRLITIKSKYLKYSTFAFPCLPCQVCQLSLSTTSWANTIFSTPQTPLQPQTLSSTKKLPASLLDWWLLIVSSS